MNITQEDGILLMILNNIFMLGSFMILMTLGAQEYLFWIMWTIGMIFLYIVIKQELKEMENK